MLSFPFPNDTPPNRPRLFFPPTPHLNPSTPTDDDSPAPAASTTSNPQPTTE